MQRIRKTVRGERTTNAKLLRWERVQNVPTRSPV